LSVGIVDHWISRLIASLVWFLQVRNLHYFVREHSNIFQLCFIQLLKAVSLLLINQILSEAVLRQIEIKITEYLLQAWKKFFGAIVCAITNQFHENLSAWLFLIVSLLDLIIIAFFERLLLCFFSSSLEKIYFIQKCYDILCNLFGMNHWKAFIDSFILKQQIAKDLGIFVCFCYFLLEYVRYFLLHSFFSFGDQWVDLKDRWYLSVFLEKLFLFITYFYYSFLRLGFSFFDCLVKFCLKISEILLDLTIQLIVWGYFLYF